MDGVGVGLEETEVEPRWGGVQEESGCSGDGVEEL